MPPGSEWHAVSAAPTVEEVDAIRQISDPVVRNLLITQAYHRLAQALAQRTGAGANWCHFATWASRQAGQTIRGEDLVETLRHRLRLPTSLVHPIHSLWRKALAAGLYDPSTRLGRLVRAVQGPLDPFEHASDAVARGNRKVFEEIGREFARFLAGPGHASAPDAAALGTFVAMLRDGDPPDGQRLLTWSADGVARVWDVRPGQALPVSVKAERGEEWRRVCIGFRSGVQIFIALPANQVNSDVAG